MSRIHAWFCEPSLASSRVLLVDSPPSTTKVTKWNNVWLWDRMILALLGGVPFGMRKVCGANETDTIQGQFNSYQTLQSYIKTTAMPYW